MYSSFTGPSRYLRFMKRLILIGMLLAGIPGHLLVRALYAQDDGTLVIGERPAWLGAHCVGGPNAGASCIMRPDDQPGQVADCPESDCALPTEPPPPDWKSRATETTQFVDAIAGLTIPIPRDATGTCAQVSLTGGVPRGAVESFATLKADYIIALDEDTCTLTVTKAKVKTRPAPLPPAGFVRRLDARLPNGITAVKFNARIRMSLRNYNPYPSIAEFGASNQFKYWDYGSAGGLSVASPPFYRDKFFWNVYEGWYPAWYTTWWNNIVPPSTGGNSMAALSHVLFYSIYGETGYIWAYQQAWGDVGYRYDCTPSWVDTVAVNWRWRCRPSLHLTAYY